MFDELIAHLTNISVLQNSAQTWLEGFSISSAVMMILACFSIVGLVDKVRGNKRGYGEKFDEGFAAMGPLALAVVGIVALSPVLLVVLQPLVTPLYNAIGASPAMFPSLLALDMGGYALAMQIGWSRYSTRPLFWPSRSIHDGNNYLLHHSLCPYDDAQRRPSLASTRYSYWHYHITYRLFGWWICHADDQYAA